VGILGTNRKPASRCVKDGSGRSRVRKRISSRATAAQLEAGHDPENSDADNYGHEEHHHEHGDDFIISMRGSVGRNSGNILDARSFAHAERIYS